MNVRGSHVLFMGSTAKSKYHPSALTITATLTFDIDPMWLDHVTGGFEGFEDVFYPSYSGYWAKGIAHSKIAGWLIFEMGSDKTFTKAEKREATRLWRDGKELPPGWHRFNLDLAKRAWMEGVKRYGQDWFSTGDGPRYDWVLQKALWGPNEPCEVRYG